MKEELTIARDQVLARWSGVAAEAARALDNELVLAFLGSASSGKDSAIRALFGIDFGEIDPIPGSTAEVRIHALDPDRRLLLVNAPGFGDLRKEVEGSARAVVDRTDLFVYIVNCDGGASVDERRDLDAIRSRGKPVLVCFNKIDLIREHQREDFVRRTRGQLGLEEDEVVVTAFDPLPALSEAPIGLEPVINWISERLQRDGKDLLFARWLSDRAAACEPIIRQAARRAALAGSLPLPGADMVAITTIQVKLISDLAAVHDQRVDKDLALFLLGELLAGGSKGFVRWAVGAMKAAGWVPGGQVAEIAASALGATIAGATTFGVGRAAVSWLQSGTRATPKELKRVFDLAADEWKVKQPGVIDIEPIEPEE